MINPQDQIRQLRNMRNDIDSQIARWQQMPQTPTIQQNFITPNVVNDFDARWVDNIQQVKNTSVMRDTIFMERDDAIFHIKTPRGEVKSFSFQEYVYLDEKDKEIMQLKQEVDKLKDRLDKGGDNNGKSVNVNDERQFTTTENNNEPDEA